MKSSFSRHLSIALPLLVSWLVLGLPAADATTIVVDSTADDLNLGPNGNCTLREAVLAANTNAPVDACPAGQPGPVLDTIQLAAATYVLSIPGWYDGSAGTQGDLDITDDVAIDGVASNATIINANGVDRIFEIWPTARTVQVRDMTLENGNPTVNSGGAVWVNTSGKVLFERVEVANNISSLNGEGAFYQQPGGFLEIKDSTIRNNQAVGAPALYTQGSASLTNCTISGNTSLPGFLPITVGAAVDVENATGHLSIVHSTFSNNVATLGYDNDLLALFGGTLTIANTIVDGTCYADTASGSSIVSLGGNLESPGATCPFTQPYDQLNVANPGLSPLAYNYSLTETHMISSTSPAHDTASPANCVAADERAVTRPQNGACDIGAVERQNGCIAAISRGADGQVEVDLPGLLAPIVPLLSLLARRRRP